MEEKHELAGLAEQVKSYAETKIEIMRLTIAGKTAKALSGATSQSIYAGLMLFALVFGSIALAIAIADLTGKASIGFLSVAVLYLIAGICYKLFFSAKHKEKLADQYVKQLLSDEEQH